jgi:flavin-dependent dehydrogenase
LTIDATGRSRILGKFAEKDESRITNHESRKTKLRSFDSRLQTPLVGFKTHLKNSAIERGRCEIYFFRGGYGGLNLVENNLANHCFLVKASIVREFGGDAERIVRELIFQNRRAKAMLENAVPVLDWLAVSVDNFGARNLSSAPNLLAIGDAGAFIDPFTGSGMLMALESGEILAQAISENDCSFTAIAETYQKIHSEKFQKRLRLCKLIRRAAFAPRLAETLISLLSLSRKPIELLAKATRPKFPVLGK